MSGHETGAGQAVRFQLFCFGRTDTDASAFLAPQGTMVWQRLQFPVDMGSCTCVPYGPVGVFKTAAIRELRALERQWYKPLEALSEADLPNDVTNIPRIKGYICHPRRPDPRVYVLAAVHVGESQVHSVAFVEKKVVFSRLGHSVEIDLSSVRPDQPFSLAVEWSPTHIEMRVTWIEGDGMEAYYSGVGFNLFDRNVNVTYYYELDVGIDRGFAARAEFATLLIPAPIAFAIWRSTAASIDEAKNPLQRSHEVGSIRKAYIDQEDFFRTVSEMLTEIGRAVGRSKPNAFWDKRQPKREPDAGAVLRMLFEAICAYKNIQVFQEDPSRSGDVDFVFSGVSIDWQHLNVVLEIKNAHSRRVDHGLTVQLPTYVKERQVATGIYGVLWYKGSGFNKPREATLDACIKRLDAMRPSAVSSVIGFDVSFSVQASKKPASQ